MKIIKILITQIVIFTAVLSFVNIFEPSGNYFYLTIFMWGLISQFVFGKQLYKN